MSPFNDVSIGRKRYVLEVIEQVLREILLHLIDTQLNDTLRTITGTIKSTPTA
ncbi:hypothetical protein Bhyg_01464, partial [Pseudolycoriella hygida]